MLTRANHDIRSPLSVIFGVFELLEDAAHLTEGERRYLQLGLQAADELLAVADGLRLYAAMERNLVTVEAGPVDLQAVVCEELRRALGDRPIAIESGATRPLPVHADEGYLRIALGNLSRHLAGQLPRPADGTATLALRQRLGTDGMVSLEVSLQRAGETDAGVAFAADDAPDELAVVNGVRLIELMGGRAALGAAQGQLEIRLPAVTGRVCG